VESVRDDQPILEPKPTACVPMNGAAEDGGTQPPTSDVSCCYHADLKKWYPYDTVNGWDLTAECTGAPAEESQGRSKA
jgi:hypothetical protein